MYSRYWAAGMVSLCASSLAGQVTSRSDSQQFASALTKVVLSSASLPGNQALRAFVIDTLVLGWNPYVAAVVRRDRPELLLSLSDSAAAYAVRLDVGSASARDGGLVVTVVWSLCNAQYQRESGRLLKYVGAKSAEGWSVSREGGLLSGSGSCSYGLNRRAR